MVLPRSDVEPSGGLSSAISTAVVRIYAEYAGRGPTKARTVISPGVITVVLEETLTRAERKLIEAGEHETVRSTRRLYQDTMRDDLIEAVERFTGRTVVAFLSDHQIDPDYAVEVFVLADGSG